MLNGRHRCDLDMTLCGSDISIQGVQYEVDSCFESKNKILLIEGKSSNKEIDSFNIRQLYFPYRVLKSATSNRKDIACLFIHELKGIVHIWSFKFEDDDAMDSITQIGHFMYKFT
jgi:hypothetical protein